MKRFGLIAGVMLALLAGPGLALAQHNTSPAAAVTVIPDGSSKTGYIYGTTSSWFVATLKAGHSYVITVAEGNDRNTVSTGQFVSGFVGSGLYQSDATTALAGYSTRHDENPAVRIGNSALGGTGWAGGWRYSYTPASTSQVFIKVYALYFDNANVSDWISYRVSVIDTTMGCTWYYTSTDYESFLEVMNTSDANVTFTAQFYNSPASSGAGAPAVGSAYSFSLAPFGTILVAAHATAGVPVGSRGAAKITHNGPPGAIKGNITTINLTGIGLTHSFNTACEPAFGTPSALGANY